MESSKFIEVGRIMETNDLSFFKPNILNRNISKSQINKLKKSIQNFGQQDEIKIKPDGTIIDGHVTL
jgi:ParB-like chromosome segregation protein Spo0J